MENIVRRTARPYKVFAVRVAEKGRPAFSCILCLVAYTIWYTILPCCFEENSRDGGVAVLEPGII